MSRIRNAWHLLRVSWGVLRQDRELLWLPIFGIVTNAVIFGPIVLIFGGSLFDEGFTSVQALAIELVFGTVFMSVTLFFEGALVAGAYQRMAGDDPTLRSALSDAAHRIHALIAWAAINVVIGTVIRMIQERLWCPAKIVSLIGALAWEFATFLTVPAIVIDFDSPRDAIRRSASLMRNTWGENIAAHMGFGLVGVAILVPAVFMPAALGAVLGTIGTVLGVMIVVAAVLAVVVGLTALTAYYKTALYLSATDGVTPEGFDRRDLLPAFLS